MLIPICVRRPKLALTRTYQKLYRGPRRQDPILPGRTECVGTGQEQAGKAQLQNDTAMHSLVVGICVLLPRSLALGQGRRAGQ